MKPSYKIEDVFNRKITEDDYDNKNFDNDFTNLMKEVEKEEFLDIEDEFRQKKVFFETVESEGLKKIADKELRALLRHIDPNFDHINSKLKKELYKMLQNKTGKNEIDSLHSLKLEMKRKYVIKYQESLSFNKSHSDFVRTQDQIENEIGKDMEAGYERVCDMYEQLRIEVQGKTNLEF